MNDRRDFLTASLMGLAASFIATHEAGAAPAARPVVQAKDCPKVNLDGWQMSATELTYPAGDASAKHRHTGFVIGYVLEGQYRFAVNNEPEKILKPGEMFFESWGGAGTDVHAVSGATAAGPAKILAIVFTKKGDQPTVPVPGI
jgi:quercetin dioxygenase-like cupin family protein